MRCVRRCEFLKEQQPGSERARRRPQPVRPERSEENMSSQTR